jgi:hypothetical protein
MDNCKNHIDNEGMPQFSLKRLFAAVTLVAICAGEIVLIRHSPIDVAPAKHLFTGFGLVIVLSLLFWPAGSVANMPQFSLKRMFVAVTLVATGIGIASFVWGHQNDLTDLPRILVPGAALFLPGFLIGAGLFSLGKRPVQTGLIAGLICGIIGMCVQFVVATTHLAAHRP